MFSLGTQSILPEWFSNDEIRNVNSLIRVTSSRSLALSIMKKALFQSDADIIINHGIAWVEITFEIITMPYETESIRFIAANNFCKILRLASKIPEIARSLSLDHVNIIVRKLLDYNESNVGPCLKSLKSILKYFPGPCGEFKGKLVKFLAPLMSGVDLYIQIKAIKCWCYIPIIGGGGKDKKEHAKQWERQFQEALDSLIYVCNNLFEITYTSHDNRIDPSIQSLSLSFQEIPSTEPQLFYSLHNRYAILCKCICSMLMLKHCTAALQFPLDKLMSCLAACFSTSFQTFGYTSEMRLRSRYLASFHKHSLEILKVLVQIFPQDICQSANVINHMLIGLFNLWKLSSTKDEYLGDCSIIRSNLYDVVNIWVQCCGWKSKFLCDENMCNVFLKNIVDDLTFQTHFKEMKWEAKQSMKKSKKRTDSLKVKEVAVKLFVSSAARVNALKVLTTSLYSHGTNIPIIVHKTIQETIIKLLLQMKHLPEHIYNQCMESRIELYRLLLALCISPHHTWPPPLHFADNFFKQALSFEKSLSTRVFLTEATTILYRLTHPQAPTLYKPNFHVIEECIKKYSNMSEPLNEVSDKTDTFQKQHLICVDAQTSTDDLDLSKFYQCNEDFEKDIILTSDTMTKESCDDQSHDITEFSSEKLPGSATLKNCEDKSISNKRKSSSDESCSESPLINSSKKQKIEELVVSSPSDNGIELINESKDTVVDDYDDDDDNDDDNLSENDDLLKQKHAVNEQSCNLTVPDDSRLSNDEVSVTDMIADFVNAKPDDQSVSDSDS